MWPESDMGGIRSDFDDSFGSDRCRLALLMRTVPAVLLPEGAY
ncbi:MAG TPA: hypothetical protein VIL06_08970 [Coriobacteriia bacterium]